MQHNILHKAYTYTVYSYMYSKYTIEVSKLFKEYTSQAKVLCHSHHVVHVMEQNCVHIVPFTSNKSLNCKKN